MCKLKPLLERWLQDANRTLSGEGVEGHLAPPIIPEVQQMSGRRRKKRTSIQQDERNRLEVYFNKVSKYRCC